MPAPDLVHSIPLRPEGLLHFRLGRLLLLLRIAGAPGVVTKPLDLERLAFYDFFSANPFLIFEADTAQRKQLVLAGFDSRTLSYQSSAQRFSNRRQRLQHDLAMLAGFGLVRISTSSGRVCYRSTDAGERAAAGFQSLYALAFVESARLTLAYLNRLSDRALRERAKTWLRAESLLIDLYDFEDS